MKAVRKDIKKDGKGDHPRDSDLKQDFNLWMRKPSLGKCLLLSVGGHRACFGLCSGCSINKPFNGCDCVKANRVRFFPFSNPFMAVPVVPAEQLVGALEFVPENAPGYDESVHP